MEPNGLSDTEILIRSRADPELFAALYRRHAAAVYRYLARRVGTFAAEDLLGDVFVAALSGRFQVTPHVSASALPWLYGIAGNVVREHLRRRSRASPDVGPGVAVVDWDAVNARLDAHRLREELGVALSVLTATELELLLLVAWEQLSPAEAAAALGITPVTARSRLHRARLRAQAELGVLATTTEEI